MKNIFKNYKILILIVFSLQSCSPDDVFINLTEEAKGFLVYDINESFKLRNNVSQETITLTITKNEVERFKSGGGPSGHIAFGRPAKVYFERGIYSFTDSSNCYTGELIITAKRRGEFEIIFNLGECFGSVDYAYEYQNEILTNTEVDGIIYSEIYLLRSIRNTIYYSREKGIIKIYDEFERVDLFNYTE